MGKCLVFRDCLRPRRVEHFPIRLPIPRCRLSIFNLDDVASFSVWSMKLKHLLLYPIESCMPNLRSAHAVFGVNQLCPWPTTSYRSVNLETQEFIKSLRTGR